MRVSLSHATSAMNKREEENRESAELSLRSHVFAEEFWCSGSALRLPVPDSMKPDMERGQRTCISQMTPAHQVDTSVWVKQGTPSATYSKTHVKSACSLKFRRFLLLACPLD